MKLSEIREEWPTMVIRLAIKVLGAEKDLYFAVDKTDNTYYVHGKITSIEVTPTRVTIWYNTLRGDIPNAFHIWEMNELQWFRLQVGRIKDVEFEGKKYYSLILPSDTKLDDLWDEKTRSSK